MSEEELTEEQLKEQKLEAAKKKYEELKKKNKKKKNKKKSKDSEDSKEDDTEETKEDSVEPETESTEAEPKQEQTGEVNEESKEEPKEESKDQSKEEPTEDLNEDVKDEPKDLSEEEPKEKDSKIDTVTEQTDEPKKEEPAVAELSSGLEKLEVSVAPSVATTDIDEDQVDSLFPDSGPSFIDSINNSKFEDEIKQLKKQNEDLVKENQTLKGEIKSLKFTKLDNQEEIETLQLKVKDLESKVAKLKIDSSQQFQQSNSGSGLQRSVYDDEVLSLSPEPSYQQPYQFNSNLSQFNGRNESSLSLNELKSKLNKWKGWNVDMTEWRSIGSGPIVEL